MKLKKPSHLAALMAIGFGLCSVPALAADSEIEALKKELAEQRQMIEKLLAERKAAPAATQAVAAPATSASGKPEVEIYGILDTGIEMLTNAGTQGKTVTRVPQITATVPSRLGVRASKEFAPGYSVLGTLEAGISLDDGNHQQSNRLFGRQAFVGLETPYGTVSVGRQYSMLLLGMAQSDMLGPNIYGTGSLDTYLPTARYDNSIAWQHKVGSVRMGLAYSFGRDTSGGAPASGTCAGEHTNLSDTQSCRAWSGMVRYDAPKFGLSAAIDQIRGGTGANAYFFNGSAPFAFTESSDKDTRYNVGGYAMLGKTRLGLGWLGRRADTKANDISSDMYYVQAKVPVTDRITVDGGVHLMKNDDQNMDATLIAVRGFYNLYKGLDTYLQVGHISNSDKARYQVSLGGGANAPAAGESQTGYMMGIRYIF